MMKLSDDDIAGLLPFYVAGTLDAREAREVAHWLEIDPRGAAALERALEEQAEVIAANERVDAPSGALAKLMQDVGAEPRKATINLSRPGLFSRLAQWLTEAPPAVSWAAAAALAVVVVVQNLPAVIQGTDTSYEVSTGTPAAGGSLYLIRFAEGADMTDISAALREVGAVIADGPKGNGNYVVRLSKNDALGPAKERAETLRAKRDIVKLLIEKSPGKK